LRCKKCLKTFRSPPIEMRENQICNVCKSVNSPIQKNEKISIQNDEDNFNYARVVEVESTENMVTQQLENTKRILEKNNQLISLEINDLKIKENKIKKEIIHEISLKEKRNGNGISKIISKFSNKNKPLDKYSKEFLHDKNEELNQIKIEHMKKIEKQKKINDEMISINERIAEKDKIETGRIENKIEQEEEHVEKIRKEPIKIRQKHETEQEEIKIQNSKNDEIKNRTCKEICKQFKAKRPPNGKRYDSGQGRCQTCDIWIDYHGAHLKDNLPATEDSIGWYCNCCNYRIRRKPRNKVYKEKLREAYGAIGQKLSDGSSSNGEINENPCPKCGIKPTSDNIESVFGMRVSGYKSIRQSYCRKCRNSTKTKTDVQNKLNPDRINQLIYDALILIRKEKDGIYFTTAEEKLKISKNEFLEILPKILRVEDIIEEKEDWGDSFKKILKSTVKNGETNEDQTQKLQSIEFTEIDELRHDIADIKKQVSKRIENEKRQKEQAPEIEKRTYEMVENYLRLKKNINTELRRKVTREFVKSRSLSKIYEEYPNELTEKIRYHVITDLRLPEKLRLLENEGGLHTNTRCSLAIAMYATDYFHWDDKKMDEDKIIDLAKSISKYLKTDNYINQLFQGKKYIKNN
jgi:hypothetical protein